MSLQIWIPMTLQRKTVNLGLAGDLEWDTTFGSVAGGKIDYCMTTGQCYMSADQTSQVLNNNEFSFCCWVQVTAAEGTAIKTQQETLFGNPDWVASDGNNRKFSIFFYPTYNDALCQWMNDESGTTGTSNIPLFATSSTMQGVFPTNKWTHFAVTYKNPNATVYINGKKYRTFSGVSNSSTFAYKTRLMKDDPNRMRRLCDYRVYNNCLSAREVYEISKGLVAHNKLTSGEFVDYSGNNNAIGRPSTTATSVDEISTDSPKYGECIKVNENSTMPSLISGPSICTTGYMNTYTVSMWQKRESIKNITIFSFGDLIVSTDDSNIMVNDNVCTTIDKIDDGNWHLYTVVGSDISSTKPALYIDAVRYEYSYSGDTCAPLSSLGNNASSFMIQRDIKSIYMSDLRIYSTNLSGDDIKELYNANVSVTKMGSLIASTIKEADVTSSRFCKGSMAIASNISEFAPTEDMEIKTMNDGSVWALIFDHNCVGGTVLFTSYNEVINCQVDNKYSRLYLLSTGLYKSATDGKHEFMLCYPDDTTLYNRWKQTNSPLNEYKGTSDSTLKADGYEAIKIAWDDHLWGGLTLQSENKSLSSSCISGSVGAGEWFYAIGAYKTYNSGIPASPMVTTDGSTAGRVQLWVRIDNTVIPDKVSIYKNGIVAKEFIEM